MKLALVSSQAGAANAFVPLIPHLKKAGMDVCIFAFKHSIDIFKGHSFAFKANVTAFECLDDLNSFDPSFLLTSSGDPEVEIPLWAWAKNKSIRSMAFLDQWTDYWERFSLKEKFDAAPDWIGVIDDVALKGCLENYCPQEKLVVVGHPYFDVLTEEANLRKNREISGRILFVSEPYAQGYGNEIFNEYVVLEHLLSLFENDEFKDYSLSIRLHPRERKDKFDSYGVHISNADKLDDLAMAEYVVGLESILVYEASLFGKKSCCFIPEEERPSDYLKGHKQICRAKNSTDLSLFLRDKRRKKGGANISQCSWERFLSFISLKAIMPPHKEGF